MNRQVFAAMVTVGCMTVLVKLVTVLKDVVLAHQFGTGDALDAVLIAFVLPQFVSSLIGGSLNVALIPTYIRARQGEGPEASQRLFSSIMIVTTACLVASSLVLALAAPAILPVLASGFLADKLALAESLYYILLGTVVLNGVGVTWGAVLNAGNRFALVAVAPVITPAIMVAAILVAPTAWGGYALAGGAVGGALIETALLGWGLSREGVSLIPRWSGSSPAVKQVLEQYVPMVAGAVLMGSTTVVSQSLSAMLDSGSVSALSYGSKVTNLLVGVVALAVSTAVLPYFSDMVAREDWKGIRHTLMTYSRLLLMVTLMITATLMYYSETIITLLFRRGAFTEADVQLVSHVQVMYLLQVPPYVLSMLFVRLISALKANHLLLWGAGGNLIVCIASSYLLMKGYGVMGIAMATSLMHFVSLAFLFIMSIQLLRGKEHRHG